MTSTPARERIWLYTPFSRSTSAACSKRQRQSGRRCRGQTALGDLAWLYTPFSRSTSAVCQAQRALGKFQVGSQV